jgi:citrate synthase
MTLTDNRTGKSYEYPILDGTRGPSVVDLRSFFTDSGMFTFDPGYTSTASCQSEITFIDGGKGELRYRGIPIEELAEKHSYLESCYLLLHGELPSKEQLTDFDLELRHRAFIPEGLRHLFSAFPDYAHPMSTLSASATALSSFYSEHLNLHNDEEYFEMAHRILAKIPTLPRLPIANPKGFPSSHPILT